jgi:hypothetical protein
MSAKWGTRLADIPTRTVEFDRWKRKLLGDLRIFYLSGLLERKTLDTFSHIRTGGNGASTAKRFELDVRDDAVLVDTYLQLHNVATTYSHEK